jgi:hypothetical protein
MNQPTTHTTATIPLELNADALDQLQSSAKKTKGANEEWPKILTEMMKQYGPLEKVIDIVQATYDLSSQDKQAIKTFKSRAKSGASKLYETTTNITGPKSHPLSPSVHGGRSKIEEEEASRSRKSSIDIPVAPFSQAARQNIAHSFPFQSRHSEFLGNQVPARPMYQANLYEDLGSLSFQMAESQFIVEAAERKLASLEKEMAVQKKIIATEGQKMVTFDQLQAGILSKYQEASKALLLSMGEGKMSPSDVLKSNT